MEYLPTQPANSLYCDDPDALLNEETLRMILEAAPIGMIAVDANGCIVLVNRNAQALFGYTAMELIGQPLSALIPEEARDIHNRYCAEYRGDPHIRPMGSDLDLSARRKDGSTFPVEISLGFTHTAYGVLSIAFIIDITKQRGAEQLRDTMLHTLVHDLRNPLSAIYTSLQVLETETKELDRDQRAVVEIALHNSERMLKFINAILEVNQLESGKLTLRPAAFRIEDQITEMLAALAPLAEEKAQRLLNDAVADLPPVYADAALIARVLENLIGNAIKFTPEHGVIRVDARRDADDPAKLRIDVNDTGPGIPAGIQNHIFGKFVTSGGKTRGHGLGLAFCRLAIEAHGESIAVQSSGPTGTTFSFTLPVATTASSFAH